MPFDNGVRHKLWIGSLVNCIATIQSLFGGLSLGEYKIVTDETKTKLLLYGNSLTLISEIIYLTLKKRIFQLIINLEPRDGG